MAAIYILPRGFNLIWNVFDTLLTAFYTPARSWRVKPKHLIAFRVFDFQELNKVYDAVERYLIDHKMHFWCSPKSLIDKMRPTARAPKDAGDLLENWLSCPSIKALEFYKNFFP